MLKADDHTRLVKVLEETCAQEGWELNIVDMYVSFLLQSFEKEPAGDVVCLRRKCISGRPCLLFPPVPLPPFPLSPDIGLSSTTINKSVSQPALPS
jgi:hypothetical protein